MVLGRSLQQTEHMRMLIAYNGATSGLGNRMRVTLGAANLATATDRRFGYVWPCGPDFEPSLQDLWLWRGGVVVPRAVSRGLGAMSGYFDDDVRAIRDVDRRWLWQIRTGGQLQVPPGVAPWYETLRTLRPAQPIADLVTENFSKSLAGHRYVGVMIRSHAVSPERTKQSSPIEWFIDRMMRTREADPGIRFFVSADVPEVKQNILDRFPTATAIPHSHAYNSIGAVRSAVADLYLLASSSYIIGPHASSFIEMAQYLADLKVPTEKPNEAPPKLTPHDTPIAWDPLRPFER